MERRARWRATAAFGASKDEVVTEFKQAFPRKKVQDVLYATSTIACAHSARRR